MGAAGSPHGTFQRAIERRNLPVALAAAHDLGWLTLDDALDLCLLLAEKDAPRFRRAALRWIARLIEERDVEIEEVALAASALAALPTGSAPSVRPLSEIAKKPKRSR